ncbi:retrovirus-related pol polyprotein from transposon TNT 1-94 [Tanacetum coccineum]|uniref:Retrovirus-related pol polyprotein from transposon TNT 1-94 n=1 Tax=Tanacetum coccineum TaxID=301880 RepID=A0ABQ4WHH8_9ASTR
MDSVIPIRQKNTLVEYMVLFGGDNRPPMLDKYLYDSWKSRMELYMQNREHERMILESVEHGPLIWPTIEENGVTRTKKYAKLFATKKIQADCDMKETNIILQVSPEWSKFVTDVKLVKDLHTTNFDQLHAYLQQHELHANEVLNQQTHLAEFPQIDSGLSVPVFKQGDDPIDAINKMMSFLSTVVTSRFPSTNNQLRNSSNPRQQATIHNGRVTVQPLQGRPNSYAAGTSGTRANTSGTGGNNSGQQRVVKCFNCQGEGHMERQCPKTKRKKDATWFRDKVLLVEAQGNGKVLNEEELEFLADLGIAEGLVTQSVITQNAAFQADDLDTYNSDCDEISTAKAVIMANLSSYGSNVLSEVPYSVNTNNDMLNQSVQEMPYSEQPHFDTNSSAQQDAMILSVFEQLSHQVTNCNKVNQDNLITNESLTAELERYKERVKLLEERQNVDLVFKNESKEKEAKNIDNKIALEKKVKELDNIVYKMGQSAQTMHMLTKPQVFYDNNLKQALSFQNPFYLKKAQQIRPMLYDGNVIAKETNVISIADSEETLMLEEESRSKILLKQSDPMVLEKKINIKPVNYALLNKLSKDFDKRFVPQQELSAKKAFSFQMSNPSTNYSDARPVKVDVPCELPKVILVNAILKKLKFHLTQFDSVVKKRITPDALTAGKVFTKIGYNWRPTGRTFTLVGDVCPLTRIATTNKMPLRVPIPLDVVAQEPVITQVVQIVLWYLDSGCSKHMTEDRSQLINFVHKFLGTVKFGNDQVAKIMGYGDYQIGNVTISRVYYVEGLGHNLFYVGQFCDSDLEVAFRKHTCFVRNLEGVDILSGSQGTNLYSLSIGDIMASSPICLLSKATKTKSWLWHRCLSHLNFGAINHLARNGLVRGLRRLKFEKDYLCFACAMGKSKKQSHKPKFEDTNQEKLYLLHMDLCGPMRVTSVNGKKYILFIVDDYSRLNATVRNIRIDNGTEFVNQTLREYYEQVKNRSRRGINKWYQSLCFENFDLEVMELENAQNNALAKLPMLKLGEYEMWEIRIKQYFQIQDYALWEVIENGNSWVPIPVTAPETGPSTAAKMTVPSTVEEKTCKKNDVKARTRLRESTTNEDTEGHAEQTKVKKSVGTKNNDKNLAFLTTSGASSTNIINTVNPEVSTGSTKVNTASTEISTANFSDATLYAFLSTQPQGSQLVHEDLEQLHDDDLEETDLKWNMALLSMRARKFYQRTGRKIIIDGSNTAGYDKSKLKCFICHKMGHFARECRALRSKDNRNWNQGSSSKVVKIEDASKKEMCAIDGAGFDWSDMAEEEIQANMALMAFSDSEVTNDKSCSKSCLKNYEALKKQYDDLLVKLDDTGFKASTYKRGLSILEGQILKYKEHEVLFPEEIALLKRSVGHKEYQMGLLRTELEKVKEEKEGFEFKIAMFEKSAKDLDQLLASQITDKSKKGLPDSKNLREEEPKKARENNDAPIIEDWVSDDEDDVEPIPKV